VKDGNGNEVSPEVLEAIDSDAEVAASEMGVSIDVLLSKGDVPMLLMEMEAYALPDGTWNGCGRATWAKIAQISYDRALREDNLTHTHIFDKLTADVMATTDPQELRAKLMKVITASSIWIHDIDTRKPSNEGG
jgi:hypothetical protein